MTDIRTISLLRSALIFLALTFSILPAALKKKPASDTYAIVSGSVFDDHGYALPDANVSLAPGAASSSATKSNDKVKPLETVTSPRGEFTFHVPAGPAQYVVSVQAKGYQRLQKTVMVQDQERVEVTFQLDPQSK
jgi:hypothetical protein